MVTVPSCRKPDGSRTREQFEQFNLAFEVGGTACTIRTVEKLTGTRVDHHMVIDFQGFKKMVDAVDGVEVCLKEPVDDADAHLKLPAGRQTLHGEQALGFVRARKSLGNGSDTERMDRQQQFLGALVNKVQSNGVLLNPARLYPVLDAATRSITTDAGLDSLRDLYDLARSMRAIPTERVQFLTVPAARTRTTRTGTNWCSPPRASSSGNCGRTGPWWWSPGRRTRTASPTTRRPRRAPRRRRRSPDGARRKGRALTGGVPGDGARAVGRVGKGRPKGREGSGVVWAHCPVVRGVEFVTGVAPR